MRILRPLPASGLFAALTLVLGGLVFGGLGGSCTQTEVIDTEFSPAQPATSKTQVFVLGMLHDGHLTSELWGLDQLRETIRRIDPDVVCLELSDDNLAATLETWNARQVVEDERALRFPEYVQVVLPLKDEMGFAVEPIAQWHEMLDAMRRGKIAEFNTQEQYAQQRADYKSAQLWTKEWLAAQTALTPDDPYTIHSRDFDLRARARAGAYDHYLNELIGRPTGWTYVHDEHYEKIINVLRQYPGKKVLVTFGTNHIYWFNELLRWHPDVELIDVRPYLPSGDSWKLTPAQEAVEEFHAGVDCLRIVWSHFRGDTLYAWIRIDAMLALPDTQQESLRVSLKAQQGLQMSEFLNGPWLGEPEVIDRGEDWWQIRVAVRRFGDRPEDAAWLSARLQVDPERPGGFAWTSLEVPGWLLHSGDTLSR